MADSDSGPESQVNLRQLAMILDERFAPFRKHTKKEKESDSVEIRLKRHSVGAGETGGGGTGGWGGLVPPGPHKC